MPSIPTFRKQILHWFAENKRELPWRTTEDPYRILVSEVMLQQTQVPRAIPIYNQFLQRFPTAADLASAELGAVLQAWRGLGYNRRARMLWECSKSLPYGNFPTDEETLLQLPGIGHYTAAAILAFWLNKDTVPIDTNIRRVHQRYFGSADELLVRSTLPHGRAREWNSALMDFGSLICTKNPRCEQCPLRRSCSAFRKNEFAIAAAKQAPFHGSNRYYRGRIIDLLRSGTQPRQALLHLGPTESIERALASLERDGLIRKRGRHYQLP